MFFIAGVTGNTGSVVAESLMAQGKPVRVLVRDAGKGAPFAARGADVMVGSLDDEATLARALEGTSGAYLLTPPRFASRSIVADNAQLAATFARAIAKSGVPHVVLLSSMGAHLDADIGTIRMAHATETTLRAAPLTILRAPFFMENWGSSLFAVGQGKLPTFFTANRAMPQIATRDIGLCAAKLLVEGRTSARIVELTGPRDYSPNDVAEALSRVLGRPIVAEQGPTAAMVPALVASGMSETLARMFQEMTEAVNAGRVVWEGNGRQMRGSVPIETVLEALTKRAQSS